MDKIKEQKIKDAELTQHRKLHKSDLCSKTNVIEYKGINQ